MNTNEETVFSNEFYLSDIELQKIDILVKDPVSMRALRKVLLAGIYLNGTLQKGIEPNPMKNWALSFGNFQSDVVSDEILGQNVRAYSWGIYALETAFKKLEELKVEVPDKEEEDKNPAL